MTVTATAAAQAVAYKPPRASLKATAMVAYAAMPESSAVRATSAVVYVSTLQTATLILTSAVQYVAVKSVRYDAQAGLIQHPYFGELKVYILWESYAPGNRQDRIVTDSLDGQARVQSGKDPAIWRGHFVVYNRANNPDGLADMNTLRAIWEQSVTFSLVDTQGNVYISDGPITFIWVGPWQPQWLGSNTSMVHIPFELREVT